MGERLNPTIIQLLQERKITRFQASSEMILKEVEGAKYDLDKARKSLEMGDFKWATVQAYYSMFHSARALLLSKGYREKSHRALLTSIEALFARTGGLEREYIDSFRDAMDLRESADYGMVYSEDGARMVTLSAEEFIQKVETILGL